MAERGSGAAVAARGLSMRGPRGWVYREVGFEAEPGNLVAIEGPAGSGRTSVLLTLAGRMRPTAGHAEVAGLAIPKHAAKVRTIAALGPMPGVNEPDDALSVGAHLRERQLLHAPLLALPARREAATRALAALTAVGLDPDRLPAGLRTPARELSRLDVLRLGMALALLGHPRLICVDDVDERLDIADRSAAWQVLRTVADSGVTVLAATTDSDHAAARFADRAVTLGTAATADETIEETEDAIA
jgi:ABC-type multidrug transport system ATPase subunit